MFLKLCNNLIGISRTVVASRPTVYNWFRSMCRTGPVEKEMLFPLYSHRLGLHLKNNEIYVPNSLRC